MSIGWTLVLIGALANGIQGAMTVLLFWGIFKLIWIMAKAQAEQ